jgi:hypothetical protein
MPELKKRFIIFCAVIIFLSAANLSAQEVPHSVANKGIYEFLDELANIHIISINSVVKPYSRLFIANKLKEADGKRDQMNTRQKKELDFYLMDFGKELDEERLNGTTAQRSNGRNLRRDLFYYRDSLFSLTVNPILGGEIFTNSSGNAKYLRNGVEARGYIHNWGFYASLRDNHEKPLLGLPPYLSQRSDGLIKAGQDWSEMQGGITYSWKWGSVGLVKENQQWGNNYNGANIFAGNNPTFVQFRFHVFPVRWFDFNYFHGWMNSMVVDSTKSYWLTNSYGPKYRTSYHKKFIAANMFTFIPFKNLNVSVGNSIIYDNETANPAYLIPLFFYKSVDHSLTFGLNNMNSQLFFDISSRQIKNLHIYATLFIDELSVSRFTRKDEWNFLSYKAGFRLSDLPISNFSFTTEFTYTYPLTFQHFVPTLTFENAGYNLGHYLKDNAQEWYIAFDYQPIRTLNINLFFLDAIRGPDYTELGTNRIGNPPLASVQWHNTSFGLKASYQVINDLYTWLSVTSGNISGDQRWSPGFFYGRKNTLNLGVTYGF